jgi:hypothetical protein
VTFAPTEEVHNLQAYLYASGGGLEAPAEAVITAQAFPIRTVTFSCNGGMATAPATQSVLDGGSVILPTADDLNNDFTFKPQE